MTWEHDSKRTRSGSLSRSRTRSRGSSVPKRSKTRSSSHIIQHQVRSSSRSRVSPRRISTSGETVADTTLLVPGTTPSASSHRNLIEPPSGIESQFKCNVWSVYYSREQILSFLGVLSPEMELSGLSTSTLCKMWQAHITELWVLLQDKVSEWCSGMSNMSTEERNELARKLDITPPGPRESPRAFCTRVADAMSRGGPPWYARGWFRTQRWFRGMWNWVRGNPKKAAAIALAVASVIAAIAFTRSSGQSQLSPSATESVRSDLHAVRAEASATTSATVAPSIIPSSATPTTTPVVETPSASASALDTETKTSATEEGTLEKVARWAETAGTIRDTYHTVSGRLGGQEEEEGRSLTKKEERLRRSHTPSREERIQRSRSRDRSRSRSHSRSSIDISRKGMVEEVLPQWAFWSQRSENGPPLNAHQQKELNRLDALIRRWSATHPEDDLSPEIKDAVLAQRAPSLKKIMDRQRKERDILQRRREAYDRQQKLSDGV